MMKKRWLAVAAAILPTAAATAGAIILTMQPGLPPGARLEVERYLKRGASPQMAGATIRVAERAARPWSFTAALSEASFGEGMYYQVSHSYLTTPAAPALLATASPGFAPVSSGGMRPLPYPPQEAWCVWLEGGGKESLVVVALHADLHNAEWALHEPAEGGGEALGCERGK